MKRTGQLALLLLIALAAVPSASVTAQNKSATKSSAARRDATTIAAVRAVIDAQRDAWNRGDVAGYMDGYERSADITFISGDNLSRGWQTVSDRYQKNYNSREKMGTLTFSDLETIILSNDAVMVLGRWHLQRTNDQPHGRFTLIFRKTKQGWRVVHDHTSSAS
ncbi:MAG TPA: nuclear transport factor 2 family protein [Pyrinomonadaceae bacterium]|nr:nuclear transport factor 2 family protein [Pyrinomonadaceae bacterium]